MVSGTIWVGNPFDSTLAQIPRGEQLQGWGSVGLTGEGCLRSPGMGFPPQVEHGISIPGVEPFFVCVLCFVARMSSFLVVAL